MGRPHNETVLMITLTPRAAIRVRAMQTEAAATASPLRVFIEEGGCSGLQYGMSFDGTPRAGDREFASEGVTIVVDAASLTHLEGTSIDFDDGLHGKGFAINNPKAKSNCGCGKSFN
jgi:iron-sulfur cluster assembly accessory protein